MQRLSDTDETVVLNVKIPASLDEDLRQLQRDEDLPNKSDAARVALTRGLKKRRRR